jgi:uncharacterized protein
MAERRPDRVTGEPHDRFWQYTADGELRLQRCQACSHVSWPPVEACEICGDTRLQWAPMSGRGRVVSWCGFVQSYYKELSPPYDCILVQLDEGPLFISNPHGFGYDDIGADMPVQVAFVDAEDGAGAYRLPVFERA